VFTIRKKVNISSAPHSGSKHQASLSWNHPFNLIPLSLIRLSKFIPKFFLFA
jgi:hypothetical protein